MALRKFGDGWQIDYYEPPKKMWKQFSTQEEAQAVLEKVRDKDPEATMVKFDNRKWCLDYMIQKRVRQVFKTKKEAKAELSKRVSLIAEGRY
jgi:hypothetical protein